MGVAILITTFFFCYLVNPKLSTDNRALFYVIKCIIMIVIMKRKEKEKIKDGIDACLSVCL